MGLMRVIFQRFGKSSFKIYAVRRTTLQRIRSKPINKPMPLLLANYHKGSDAISCESKVLVPFTRIYFTGRWLGFRMQWIVLHTFLGYLDKTAFLKNDIFLFLVSFLDSCCWRLWKCSMQPHFEGVLCDLLRYHLHASCRVRKLDHSTTAQVILVTLTLFKGKLLPPSKDRAHYPSKHSRFSTSSRKGGTLLPVREDTTSSNRKRPTDSKRKKLIITYNERGGSLP